MYWFVTILYRSFSIGKSQRVLSTSSICYLILQLSLCYPTNHVLLLSSNLHTKLNHIISLQVYVPKEQQIKEFENLKIKEKKKNEDQNKTKNRRISQVIDTNIINLI